MSTTNLDALLLRLSTHDYLGLRQSFEHFLVMGGTGSGKTTGPGRALASALLRAGAGALVMVAKSEEIDTWVEYARKNGRSNSLVIFDHTRGFNFIDHELSRQGVKGLGTVIEYIVEVLEAADMAMGTGARESDAFWLQSVRTLLTHSVPLIYAAWGTVSVNSIVDFVTSAAADGNQYLEPGLADRSFAAKTLRKVVDAPCAPLEVSRREELMTYWFVEYPAIPERTRGNIVVSLSAKLDRFRHGRLRDCFCGKTDIVPEMAFLGAIILVAMPALTWNQDGVIGQKLLKSAFQRTVLTRGSLAPHLRERPVVLWADEAQLFVTDTDHEFLSVCRSSRCGVVYLSQSLPTFFAQLGPGKQDAAEALIGKFGTQIFCANGCAKTNQYASQLIGRGMQYRRTEGRSTGTSFNGGMSEGTNVNRGYSSNSGHSYGPGGGSFNSGSGNNSGSGENYGTTVGRGTNTGRNYSVAENMDVIVEPRFFASELKTGGPANNYEVSAIWFKTSGNFIAANGGNFLLTTFNQRKP